MLRGDPVETGWQGEKNLICGLLLYQTTQMDLIKWLLKLRLRGKEKLITQLFAYFRNLCSMLLSRIRQVIF
jgi:hypothetical protein